MPYINTGSCADFNELARELVIAQAVCSIARKKDNNVWNDRKAHDISLEKLKFSSFSSR